MSCLYSITSYLVNITSYLGGITSYLRLMKLRSHHFIPHLRLRKAHKRRFKHHKPHFAYCQRYLTPQLRDLRELRGESNPAKGQTGPIPALGWIKRLFLATELPSGTGLFN